MRTCVAVLLALLLSLNTAYAAVVGVCDALEHTQSHASHFGHHDDEHGDDHAHDTPPVDPEGKGNAPSPGDHHHHAHVHPGFFSLLSTATGVTPFYGRLPLVAVPVLIFISAPQDRIERPPRAALA